MKTFQEGDSIFVKPGDEFVLLTEENLGLFFEYEPGRQLAYCEVEISYEEKDGTNVQPAKDSKKISESLLLQGSIQAGYMTIDYIHCASLPHLCTESDLHTAHPDYYKLIFSDARSMLSDYAKGL